MRPTLDRVGLMRASRLRRRTSAFLTGMVGAACDAKALALYHQSVAWGDDAGKHRLGGLCKNGLGVRWDTVEAVRWYTRAANKGIIDAKKALERLK